MADHILRVGNKMSVDHMAKLFQTWEPTAPSWWDSNIVAPARTQMLSDDTTVETHPLVTLTQKLYVAGQVELEGLWCITNGCIDDVVSAIEQMLAPGDSRLCAKKDLILGKFDQLLRKLGGEELSLNISLGKMGEEWHAAMEGWLDAESTYRLRIEQARTDTTQRSCGMRPNSLPLALSRAARTHF